MRYCTANCTSTMFSSSVSMSASLVRFVRCATPMLVVRTLLTSTSCMFCTGEGKRQWKPGIVASE